MNLLENYGKKVIKYDLINKFNYNKIDNLPHLKKIILNFECKSLELKKLGATLLALEFITSKRGILTKSKKPNILLKIRRGHPVGCCIVLKKKAMYSFFLTLIADIIPNLRDFKGLHLNKKSILNSLTFTIKELITFNNLENNFYLFNDLPYLNVTIITNTKTQTELFFLMESLKIPIIK